MELLEKGPLVINLLLRALQFKFQGPCVCRPGRRHPTEPHKQSPRRSGRLKNKKELTRP